MIALCALGKDLATACPQCSLLSAVLSLSHERTEPGYHACVRPGADTLCHMGQLWPTTCLVNEVLLDKVMPFCLHIVHDCFCAIRAEFSCNRDYVTQQSLQYLLWLSCTVSDEKSAVTLTLFLWVICLFSGRLWDFLFAFILTSSSATCLCVRLCVLVLLFLLLACLVFFENLGSVVCCLSLI